MGWLDHQHFRQPMPDLDTIKDGKTNGRINMDRNEALAKAKDIINGPRNDDYGPARDNFMRIAIGWSVIFAKPITPKQVALAMDWLKTARLVNRLDHMDGWVDKIGYSAIGVELESQEELITQTTRTTRERKNPWTNKKDRASIMRGIKLSASKRRKPK